MISKNSNSSFSSSSVQSLPSISSAIDSIEKELEHLDRFVDVHAIILFRLDGQVLKSSYSDRGSPKLITAISWVKNIISKTTEELKRGSKSVKYDKEVNPGENMPVYFYRVGNSSFLVTFLDSKANTGLMEIEMSRTAKRLGWIIDNKRALGD
jgi:predicted regulator of Ras-like GTPase activity (Roadblock/LC7/MglB family)